MQTNSRAVVSFDDKDSWYVIDAYRNCRTLDLPQQIDNSIRRKIRSKAFLSIEGGEMKNLF